MTRTLSIIVAVALLPFAGTPTFSQKQLTEKEKEAGQIVTAVNMAMTYDLHCKPLPIRSKEILDKLLRRLSRAQLSQFQDMGKHLEDRWFTKMSDSERQKFGEVQAPTMEKLERVENDPGPSADEPFGDADIVPTGKLVCYPVPVGKPDRDSIIRVDATIYAAGNINAVHWSRSGISYNRQEQYLMLSNHPGDTNGNWMWIGQLRRSPNIFMGGIVNTQAGNRITYTEVTADNQSLSHTTLATTANCEITSNEGGAFK